MLIVFIPFEGSEEDYNPCSRSCEELIGDASVLYNSKILAATEGCPL